MSKKIFSHWFILGANPLVSLAELFAVYPGSERTAVLALNAPAVRLDIALPPTALANLGGTIKTGVEIAADLSLDDILAALSAEFPPDTARAIFGISVYGSNPPAEKTDLAESLGLELKKCLAARDIPARYVDNRREPVLSSASVVYNKLLGKGQEFLIIPTNENSADLKYAVAVTSAVQPFQDLSARDFGRPGRDDKSGMLPPKLALMMLNLAIEHSLFDIRYSIFQILDPFCGSGTILTEAFLQGYTNVIGSDISEKAIADTKKNFNWLEKNYSLLPPGRASGRNPTTYSLRLFPTEVAKLSDQIPAHTVDAIITEPYLGPPLRGGESAAQIKKNCSELSTLYQSAFKSFVEVLRPSGVVVIIIPRFFIGGVWYTVSDKIMAEVNRLGFKKDRLLPAEITPNSYVLYHRPGQFVGREIWRFRLGDNNA